LAFEDQQLTSFSGLTVFQALFAQLDLRNRLQGCFSHLQVAPIFGHGRIALLLVVHLLLGFRRLQELRYYRDDPLVLRTLGLARLPDVATVSRSLAMLDERSVLAQRRLLRQIVLDRLAALSLSRLTLDFDGSVLGSCRYAEGTAVGYNRKKKGQRSYYPLFCTVAQTGQVLDVWHRPGNVHDSNGARAFIVECIEKLRSILPACHIEVRMDSAFFSEEIVTALQALKTQFTISVPFERLTALKDQLNARTRWQWLSESQSYFESSWKPHAWDRRFRFIFIRERQPVQRKEPVQLELFQPYEYGYQFKVIVTNSTLCPRKVLRLHNGRGAQEGIFAELKSQTQMDYIPTRRLAANQTWLLASLMAHNLNRELQMATAKRERATTEKRAPLWMFTQLGTLRRHLIQRAGRLTRPQGKLTLTLSPNDSVQADFKRYLKLAA
jgi:hypothetical protein